MRGDIASRKAQDLAARRRYDAVLADRASLMLALCAMPKLFSCAQRQPVSMAVLEVTPPSASILRKKGPPTIGFSFSFKQFWLVAEARIGERVEDNGVQLS